MVDLLVVLKPLKCLPNWKHWIVIYFIYTCYVLCYNPSLILSYLQWPLTLKQTVVHSFIQCCFVWFLSVLLFVGTQLKYYIQYILMFAKILFFFGCLCTFFPVIWMFGMLYSLSSFNDIVIGLKV